MARGASRIIGRVLGTFSDQTAKGAEIHIDVLYDLGVLCGEILATA
jgi:hypothetical protein